MFHVEITSLGGILGPLKTDLGVIWPFRAKNVLSWLCTPPYLRINNSTGSNNHLRSIDLFRSMIISNDRSKIRDEQLPPLSVKQSVRNSQNVVRFVLQKKSIFVCNTMCVCVMLPVVLYASWIPKTSEFQSSHIIEW